MHFCREAHNIYPMTKELVRKLATRFLKADLLDVSVDILENEEKFLPLPESNI